MRCATATAPCCRVPRRRTRTPHIEGVLVQAMARPGVEMILGITRDADYGPMLMVGLGGIHVEVLRDVAFAPVPLGRDDAARLARRIARRRFARRRARREAGRPRGAGRSDRRAVAFRRRSRRAVAEIDLNPVIVHPEGEGLTVVDALIVKRRLRRASEDRSRSSRPASNAQTITGSGSASRRRLVARSRSPAAEQFLRRGADRRDRPGIRAHRRRPGDPHDRARRRGPLISAPAPISRSAWIPARCRNPRAAAADGTSTRRRSACSARRSRLSARSTAPRSAAGSASRSSPISASPARRRGSAPISTGSAFTPASV